MGLGSQALPAVAGGAGPAGSGIRSWPGTEPLINNPRYRPRLPHSLAHGVEEGTPESSTSSRNPGLRPPPQGPSAQLLPARLPPRRCPGNRGAVAAAKGAELPSSDALGLGYKRRRLRRTGRNFPERSVRRGAAAAARAAPSNALLPAPPHRPRPSHR